MVLKNIKDMAQRNIIAPLASLVCALYIGEVFYLKLQITSSKFQTIINFLILNIEICLELDYWNLEFIMLYFTPLLLTLNYAYSLHNFRCYGGGGDLGNCRL